MNKIAKIITEDLRDAILNSYLDVETGFSNAPRSKALHKEMEGLTVKQKKTFFKVLTKSVDAGIHDFLFKMQELYDSGEETGLYQDGKNIASESDGLQGEIFTEDGWFAKYSQYEQED